MPASGRRTDRARESSSFQVVFRSDRLSKAGCRVPRAGDCCRLSSALRVGPFDDDERPTPGMPKTGGLTPALPTRPADETVANAAGHGRDPMRKKRREKTIIVPRCRRGFGRCDAFGKCSGQRPISTSRSPPSYSSPALSITEKLILRMRP